MKKYLRQGLRRAGRACRVAAGWLALCGAAWGAPPAAAKQDSGPSVGSGVYVMAYFLVIFGIAAGMLFVCRSSNRRDRAKPEQYGEGKKSSIVKPEGT